MYDVAPPDPSAAFAERFPRILIAAKAGGEWAWREVYGATAPTLTRYLRARGVPDADDVVGETFVRVVRNIERFEGDLDAFRTWVFTIARNIVIDAVRSRTRRPTDAAPVEQLVALGPLGDAEADAIGEIARSHVREVLDSLRPDQRDVLLLRLVGGLTIAEIAAVMDKREGAVKMLQARALAVLRKKISVGAVTL
jgi:RNA polymerase sigma-70 factor (ECF subfamily)